MTVGPVYREFPALDLFLKPSRATIIKGAGERKTVKLSLATWRQEIHA